MAYSHDLGQDIAISGLKRKIGTYYTTTVCEVPIHKANFYQVNVLFHRRGSVEFPLGLSFSWVWGAASSWNCNFRKNYLQMFEREVRKRRVDSAPKLSV